jgi:hypothetical protein
MRVLAVLMTMLAGLHGVAQAATPEQIAGLIERLGSTDYRERQAAFRELDALGETALPRLKSTAATADSETRCRATELIRRIEQRQTSSRILAPTLVQLDVDNLPIKDAVTHAVMATGFQISTVGNTSKLSDRKVTYHSGKITAWEAMAGFLQAAQLAEWDGVTNVPGLPVPQTATPEGNQQVFFRGNGRMVIAGAGRNAKPTHPVSQFMVYDAAPTALPTFTAGSVRVRALPVGTPISTLVAKADEILIPLQVSTEPKIDWILTPPSVKIAEGIDDHGQRLTASIVGAIPATSDDPEMMVLNNLVLNQMAMAQGLAAPRSQFVGLRLRQGRTATKSLREVTGILALPVRVADELIVVDKPMKAAGATTRGEYGEITLHSIEQTPDGHIKMDLAWVLSPDIQVAQTAAGNQVIMQGNVRFNGAFFIPPAAMTHVGAADGATDCFFGVSLLDGTGARFAIGDIGKPNVTFNTDGLRVRTTLTFRPFKENGEPARLIVKGTHPASVELPFALKDVPVQ